MEACVIDVSVHISIMDDVSKYFKSVICRFLNFPLDASIVGSVVEFSPATRETGVRFPANAFRRLYVQEVANLTSKFKQYSGQNKGTTGFEPVTSRSAVECSTTELYPQ